MRLKDIGILSEATVSYAFQTYARSWRTAEPMPLEAKGPFGQLEKPTRFERSVYWALADRLISLPRAADLLRRPVAQVELAMRGPTLGDFSHCSDTSCLIDLRKGGLLTSPLRCRFNSWLPCR